MTLSLLFIFFHQAQASLFHLLFDHFVEVLWFSVFLSPPPPSHLSVQRIKDELQERDLCSQIVFILS